MTIKEADIETVVQLSLQIPEFYAPYTAEVYINRFTDKAHLILVAYEGKTLLGFKVGYEREKGSFYSWMGAVLPKHRRKGVAQALADYQEAWAIQQGYDTITFKTRNRLKAMLSFALNNGFYIFKVEERARIEEYRIWLRKRLI
ncbi:MAG: GNAT family N-acetyltransferase [Bacteroidota bacterium]